ncbi:Neuropeptide-Like Protein [Caenorhabditis elegans]|uniref:Neuropeptide-Like Protein n=1 Tax=Caenorhabditis elegans TaxID=6239 RepID=O62211_CAEEL|nr:Neuropeptide-Like Protein [Caenorhabditis elegans]CAB04255.2 Neuropeptide-Like Protein [Caenorhabditis elegans]|eukprot:NP_496365.2 Neuropeptide-Like Protein [Caenorhabditis elegans]
MNANVYSIVYFLSFLVLCISAQLHADSGATEVDGIVDKRSPYRAFAFAKRSDEENLDFLEKRARYGFAKRSPYRTFAFAKRASPYGFAFAKRGQFSSFA